MLAAAESQLYSAEAEANNLNDLIALLDDKSSNILKREIQVLSAFKSLPSEGEVVLANPDFIIKGTLLIIDYIN